MGTDVNATLRRHLLELLGPGGAHADFDRAIADLPVEMRGKRAAHQPHTPWRLLQHMRIAQHDILQFARDARHKSPAWPAEYWPDGDSPAAGEWDVAVAAFVADRKAIIALLEDPTKDLLAPLPHASGKAPPTLAREAMLLADHTAYHLGQLILLRRVLGCWTD